MSEKNYDASDVSLDGKDGKKPDSGITRRTFTVGLGSTVVLLGLGSLRYLGSTPQVRPPGGQDEDALVGKCIHCYRCVEACPRFLIQPTDIEAGILNRRTPRMEFSDNYPGLLDSLKFCDFCAEHNGGVPLCVQACPSTALSLGAEFSPKTAVIGKAELDASLCIAYRSGHCAFCHDACVQVRGEENSAIYYQNADAQGGESTRLPVVDPGKCNGCGACESVCVSTQAGSIVDTEVRAIVVKPL